MSFSTGNKSQQSEINVTPLIDVLLVLLIIFMLLVPIAPSGLKALSPQPAARDSTPATSDPATIVVQVHAHPSGLPTYSINEQPIAKEAITARLMEIFSTRQQRVMFVKGDAELEFNSIAEVVGFGHKALVDNIGVLTPGTEQRN